MKSPRLAAIALAFSMALPPAHAEVVAADPAGFVVRHELSFVAPRETVWRMLLGHVGEWWHSDHTYSGDAQNLYIEPRALGCFCEDLGAADAVAHLTVTAIRTEALLRLTGGLGPLGLMGVDGNMVFSLADSETGTAMVMEYRVGGYDPDGLDGMAPAVDNMLGEQLARLVLLVETGSPELDQPIIEGEGGDMVPESLIDEAEALIEEAPAPILEEAEEAAELPVEPVTKDD